MPLACNYRVEGITDAEDIIPLLALFLVLSVSLFIVIQTAGANNAPVENSWASKAPMHEARSDLGVAGVNGKICAIGGINVPSVVDFKAITTLPMPSEPKDVGANEEYDPLTNTWFSKTEMPVSRSDFVVAVFQNKIYCIGGMVGRVNLPVNEVYDPAKNNWETKASIPTPKEGLQANVVNDKIYVIGGGPNYVYNPAADNWTTMAPMPNTPNGTQSSCVYGNKIYVVGSPCIQIYNPENDSWTTGIQIPMVLTQPIALATSGLDAPARIYVFEQGILATFNPQTNSWMADDVLPKVLPNRDPDIARVLIDHQGYGVSILNDVVYVVGGETVTVSQEYANSRFYPEDKSELAINQQYTPFGYGTVPLEISVASLTNAFYSSSNITLNFAVNKPVNWAGYSLDGQPNVTLTGNGTMANLPSGTHVVTVYANDTNGNVGVSQPVAFTVEKLAIKTAPTTVLSIIAVSIAVICVAAGLRMYRKKR
jgi:N-acetylneuraminic acid mutarotase